MSSKEISEFAFDGYRIDPGRRLLLKQGEVVPLMAKSFDLLLALVENGGQLVTKNELLERVWENQFVSENNLSVHIAALRKALGETKEDHRYIVTVSGKGYRFVGDLNATKETNGHELVVERHRFQRIVVENADGISQVSEREIHHGLPGAPAPLLETGDHVNSSSRPSPIRRRFYWAGLLAVAVALIAGGGFWISRRAASNWPAIVPFAQHRIRQLTTNGKVGSAALSPDGKLFAYTVDDLGQKSLWLGFVDGGNHLQLREPADAAIGSLMFSGDSRELFFLLLDEKNPKSTLFRMPAQGGVPVRIREDLRAFSLSPDATTIAYPGTSPDGKHDVIMVSGLQESAGREVASFPKEFSIEPDSISWSPDGKRLAVSRARNAPDFENEIAIVDIATATVKSLAHKSFREITKTAWLPDGSGLIITGVGPPAPSSVPQYRLWYVGFPNGETLELTGDRSNYGASWHNDAGVSLSLAQASNTMLTVEHRQLANIWIAPAAELAGAKQITFSSFGKYDGLWGLDWAPDGTLFYTTSDTTSQFVAHVKSDGTDATTLTSPGYFDSVLTVSTDGRYVVFHSNRGSQIDIWRMDRDGTNLKQLTFGGKGLHPALSPDGKWVYYKSNLDGSGALFRVPIDGGEPEKVTKGAAWWPSFSPDGKYFSALYATDKNRLAIFLAATNELVKQFDLPKSGTLYMGSRWTPDGKSVTFRDKNYGYWIQPIDGGEARRLEGLPKERLYNFSWSRDGKWLAFVRGPEIRDVVLIESVKQ